MNSGTFGAGTNYNDRFPFRYQYNDRFPFMNYRPPPPVLQSAITSDKLYEAGPVTGGGVVREFLYLCHLYTLTLAAVICSIISDSRRMTLGTGCHVLVVRQDDSHTSRRPIHLRKG
jgi:hypothetical protein